MRKSVKKKQYDRDFKISTVKMITEGGHKAAEVARSLGIHPTQLYNWKKKFSDKVATLLSDGQVEVDGVAYISPSPAASKIVGYQMNGWWFFLTDQSSRRSLRNVRRDYVENMAVDAEDDEPDDEDDDEV